MENMTLCPVNKNKKEKVSNGNVNVKGLKKSVTLILMGNISLVASPLWPVDLNNKHL